MNKAIFLDRDGTINVDYGYVYQREKLKFVDGVILALKRLQAAGFLLIIITNQSGIGRGYFNMEQYKKFEQYFLDRLAYEKVYINKVYFCPHLEEENCTCRKPKTGLFEKAAKEYDIDWQQSYAIGDRERDLCICKKYPVNGILFSDKNCSTEYVHFTSWNQITDYILK